MTIVERLRAAKADYTEGGIGFLIAEAADRIEALEARWEKYTEPGVNHPRQAPERVWVQWMPKLRTPMVYLRPPAILDGTTGCYVLSSAMSAPTGKGSPTCLDCGHPLTEADRQAPVCPYCGCA